MNCDPACQFLVFSNIAFGVAPFLLLASRDWKITHSNELIYILSRIVLIWASSVYHWCQSSSPSECMIPFQQLYYLDVTACVLAAHYAVCLDWNTSPLLSSIYAKSIPMIVPFIIPQILPTYDDTGNNSIYLVVVVGVIGLAVRYLTHGLRFSKHASILIASSMAGGLFALLFQYTLVFDLVYDVSHSLWHIFLAFSDIAVVFIFEYKPKQIV